jgi:hypothetical protein
MDLDTHPSMDAVLINRYRAMSPIEKLQRVCSMTAAVQQLALADIRRRHPTANLHEQLLRLASRSLEPELMRRAFGWDVQAKGY